MTTQGNVSANNLTKREYFAAKALAGLMAGPMCPSHAKNAAKEAVELADELINALNQPK